jgi:serine/threonine protein kinase
LNDRSHYETDDGFPTISRIDQILQSHLDNSPEIFRKTTPADLPGGPVLNDGSRQNVTIDTNQFWHLLGESKLVDSSTIRLLTGEFDAVCSRNSAVKNTAADAAKWLTKKQLITRFQAQILLAGHSGPVRFGDYVLTEPFSSEPAQGEFRGRHLATKFPVHLQFLAGSTPSDLVIWKQVEALTEKVASIQDPSLVELFETVVLPEYRFVVSEARRGKRLSILVPRKGRMPWPDACVIMAQVARAVNQLHAQSIVHNAISPRTIWVESGGRSKLEVALWPDEAFENPEGNHRESRFDYLAQEALSETPQITAQSDMYAFGCTLYRIIAGKTLFSEEPDRKSKPYRTRQPAHLEKYNVPSALQELLDRLLAEEPQRRPGSAAEIADQLCELAGKPDLLENSREVSDENLKAFRARVGRNRLAALALDRSANARPVEFAGALETNPESKSVAADAIFTTRNRAASVAPKRKLKKWRMPMTVAAALMIMSGLIGLFAYQASQTNLIVAPNPAKPEEVAANDVQPVAPPTAKVIPTSNTNLVQVLIDDDAVTLWESPTTGPPLSLDFHPTTSRIIFAFRPGELLSSSEGKQLLRSLGPVLNKRIEDWREQLGLELDDIEQLIISLHPGPQSSYDSFASIKLSRPTTVDELIKTLGNPTPDDVGDLRIYNKPDGTAFYIIPDQARAINVGETATTGTDETVNPESPATGNEPSLQVTRFVFGKAATVRAVAEAGGLNILSGTIKKLVDRSDADRHFTMLFLRPALFNEQGQSLMGRQLATLNRQLDLFLQDEIRGGMFSFHIDQGDYFEIVFDQTVDLESRELKESLQNRLRVFRDEITRFLANIPANEYWDKVRLRYDNMLADVYRSLRWEVEFGSVVGNCWLPPMAGHNLVAASELVTAFSSDSAGGSAVVVARKTPSSLSELLLTRRSLRVTTNPDLNLLLNGIRSEILDDFGRLPFDFQIRLIGNDLQKEGITQNQRPGDFQIDSKPLAEILTEIMVRCNPDKSISGPHDPNCKLVWTVGPDPADAENDVILITTRAGASEKQLSLPEDFQPQ